MNSYRELEIYKTSKALAIRIHGMTMTLPKFEIFEEGGQIRRSSKAVTSNIVEGYGRRRYKAEFVRYLICSITECDETIMHLDFLFETDSLKDAAVHKNMKEEYVRLSKQINKYIQWVENIYIA